MGAGVEPGHAASHDRDFKGATLKVFAVDIGDFKFATSRRLERSGDVGYLRIIKIEAGDGVTRLRHPRLFFQADGLALGIKFHHTVALRIMDWVSEDASALFAFGRVFHALSEIVAVENIV